MKRVLITRRTAYGLKNTAKRYRAIGERFKAVNSMGRYQTFNSLAVAIDKVANDLLDELQTRKVRSLTGTIKNE